MKTEPWNKCDWCGKFIGLEDLVDGLATREMVTPDSHHTQETFENKCKDCHYREDKDNE